MKLSIIIPVYNEEKTVVAVLDKLINVKVPDVITEIIVVDDGSNDRSVAVVKKGIAGKKNMKLIEHTKNIGKGAAVKTGIDQATGDYILIQDADLEYNPAQIPMLVEPIINKHVDVVFGTRLNRWPNFARDERTPQFLLQYLGNRFLSLVTSILYGEWLTDMETGYKIFPRAIFKNISLNSKSFDFEPEITAKILKSGKRILEIPISTNPRGYDKGKKLVAFHDGPIALWTLLKYRFTN